MQHHNFLFSVLRVTYPRNKKRARPRARQGFRPLVPVRTVLGGMPALVEEIPRLRPPRVRGVLHEGLRPLRHPWRAGGAVGRECPVDPVILRAEIRLVFFVKAGGVVPPLVWSNFHVIRVASRVACASLSLRQIGRINCLPAG